MALIKKKGERGAASNYITRTRAIRKLQLSLADFRRLCILKGIYPRQPSNRKKAAGKSGNTAQTFYYSKDIQYLLHEPLVQKLRDRKAFMKKLSRAIGKREESVVRKLEENRPEMSLDHLVKERYPTFNDSLRDMDDCLCHVSLFATLPVSDNIVKKHVEGSQRLVAEFQNYVISQKCLRKVFLSIKGIYYQADVRGQTITWLVPYQFSQDIPADVDFRVMLTFLEFYQTMLGFINYKLYTDAALFYPPKLDAKLDEHGAGLIAAYKVESTEESIVPEVLADGDALSRKEKSALKKQVMGRVGTLDSALQNIGQQTDADEVMEEIDESVDDSVNLFPEATESTSDLARLTSLQTLFAGKRIFLSREVPRYALEFVIRAFGGVVAWPETSGPGSPFAETSADITHHVIDRPAESMSLMEGRVYVQPQWVFDCINAGNILDPVVYAPGASLPPHLSPFVAAPDTDMAEMDLDEDEVETKRKSGPTSSVLDRVNQVDSAENLHELELEAEVTGVEYSKVNKATASIPTKRIDTELKKKLAEKNEDAEKVERAKMMMSNKKRKLFEQIERKKQFQAADSKKLEKRRRDIASTVKK